VIFLIDRTDCLSLLVPDENQTKLPRIGFQSCFFIDRLLYMKLKSIILLSIVPLFLFANDSNDESKLKISLEKEFPGVQIKTLDKREGFQFCWELMIPQQLDHWNKGTGTFPQKIILYHRSFKEPNVLITEGYDAAERIYESTMILNANQFSVEYRFFGVSKPEQIDWKLLNHKQALEDLHTIRNKLSKVYKKSWIATGISKGGTTTALYSLTYPKDVKAAVAYVAPFVTEQEDQRTIEHYRDKVSTAECRQKVKDFQRNLLMHREEIKPMLTELEKRDQVSFVMDKDRVIDFAAMEYPFSIWQWGFGCTEIPDKSADAKAIFDQIEEVVDFNYYDNKTCSQFLPAYFQFMTEFGYYGFDTTGLSDLLINKHISNLEFCPKNADLSYHPEYMKEMTRKANESSHNIIYIYGELDTWTSCAVNPASETNAIKLVKEGGGHRTRIKDFSNADRHQIFTALEKWTKHKTQSLPY
jgi:hypothetical protein